jgi:alkylresorcinol/alkylpyrone synthase
MDRPPRLTGLATASPPTVLSQSEARAGIGALFEAEFGRDSRLLDVFVNGQIDERHVCMPLEWYLGDHDFAEKNALYVEHAVRLAEEATRAALDQAGLEPRDVDQFLFVSSTGLATPSIDTLVAGALGMRADIRRTPIWGLGCAGGAAGLARAAEFARADPGARVLLVALELCSLTFQRRDLSKRNLVAASLFADGAAAAIVAGADVATAGGAGARRPLAIEASASTLWKDTRDIMGWQVDADGLTVVLSRDLPAFVRREVGPSLAPFLERRGLVLGDVAHMVAHPGGVKVLDAWGASLDLPAEAFRHSRAVLRSHGNMSSPSCLFVLERFRDADEIGEGERALVSALGPGFGVEYVLLRGEAA